MSLFDVLNIILPFLSPEIPKKLMMLNSKFYFSFETHLKHPDSVLKLLNLIQSFPRFSSCIKHLHLSSTVDFKLGDLEKLLNLCDLISLNLDQGVHFSNLLMKSLCSCKSLESLSLVGAPISDKFIPDLVSSCTSLSKIDLSFSNISMASLPFFLLLPNLHELSLSGAHPAEFSNCPLDLNIISPIKILNLKNSHITDNQLYAILQCKSLEELVLESCNAIISDSILCKIAQQCPLKSLDISFCDATTDKLLNVLAIKAASSNGGALKEIILCACDKISPASIHQLAQKATHLELIVLDGCQKIINGYISNFCINKSSEISCTLNKDGIQRLAKYSLNSNMSTVEPLKKSNYTSSKTLTRQASRIMKQKSSPLLTEAQFIHEAEAFEKIRMEKIIEKRNEEDELKSLYNDLDQDCILLASGRKNRHRTETITPPKSTNISTFTMKNLTNGKVEGNSWGNEPKSWNNPSTYRSSHSSFRTPIKIRIEIRRNVFETFVFHQGMDIKETVYKFCKLHGLDSMGKLETLIESKLQKLNIAQGVTSA